MEKCEYCEEAIDAEQPRYIHNNYRYHTGCLGDKIKKLENEIKDIYTALFFKRKQNEC